MSTDKFDVVTAIASRQPALNPARHHVSPAVLEFRLQQVTLERDQLAESLSHILDMYAPDENDSVPVIAARALLARIKA